MKQNFNYNNSLYIWENQRKACLQLPYLGPIHTVSDGHVSNGLEILARFSSNEEAIETLEKAGFIRVNSDKLPAQFKAKL